MLGQVQLRKEIAARLKQARLAAGHADIEEFCKAHALDEDQYKRHEAGKTSLRASQAMRYCDALRISLHWLMLGEEYQGRKKAKST